MPRKKPTAEKTAAVRSVRYRVKWIGDGERRHAYLYERSYRGPAEVGSPRPVYTDRYLGRIDDARAKIASPEELAFMAARLQAAAVLVQAPAAPAYRHPIPERIAAFAAGIRTSAKPGWSSVARVVRLSGLGEFTAAALRVAVEAWSSVYLKGEPDEGLQRRRQRQERVE